MTGSLRSWHQGPLKAEKANKRNLFRFNTNTIRSTKKYRPFTRFICYNDVLNSIFFITVAITTHTEIDNYGFLSHIGIDKTCLVWVPSISYRCHSLVFVNFPTSSSSNDHNNCHHKHGGVIDQAKARLPPTVHHLLLCQFVTRSCLVHDPAHR